MAEHLWRFFVAGGVDQVQLQTGKDLINLRALDQKLWVALACPTTGVEFDERTLELLDTDKDKRVRASEMIEAAEWCGRMLSDVEVLANRKASLFLSAISEGTDDSKLLKKTAERILETVDKAGSKEISVEDTEAATASFDKQKWNGDGVIPASSVEDETLAAVFADALKATAEPSTDRNGDPGLNAAQIDVFFDNIAAHATWLENGVAEDVKPLGDDTQSAWDAIKAVRAKVDDYFARVNVAAYDSRALTALNREETEYLAIAAKDLHISSEEVAHFPLARVSDNKTLPLYEGLNPAWMKAIHTFRDKAIVPILGEKVGLLESEWLEICAKFSAYEKWVSAKPEASVGDLSADRIKELNVGTGRDDLKALVDKDLEVEPMAKALENVEKLVRFNRDLMAIANNFVAFRDFYSATSPGIFQLGTLYIDRRACNLCVHVTDAGRHASMASHSNAYLLYCDLKNAKGEKMAIAAAVTDGDIDNLMVGRNGVFYDRDGNDWDATVTKIVENPISIRQAFWSPYKKFLRMIEDQISKRAQDAEAKSQAKVDAAAKATDAAATGGKAVETKPAESKKLDVGVVAALGVAVGGLTAALGMVLEAFFGLGIWMPVGFLALLLVISGPSMAIAWMKLRKRNLGPLLDANGWAVNSLAKINVPFGRSLTSLAVLPEGAARDHVDPFADKKRHWGVWVFLFVLIGAAIAWYLGKLDTYLPPQASSVEVLGEYAPRNTADKIKAEAEAEAAKAAEPAADAAPAAPAGEAPAAAP